MNRKTIQIKLDEPNRAKLDKIQTAYDTVQVVAVEYLKHKHTQLETKDYSKTSKEMYAEYRGLYPALNSALLQQTFRRCDELVKSNIAWSKKKHKLVSFPEKVEMPLIIRDVSFKENDESKTFDAWFALWRTQYPVKLCKYHKDLFKRAKRCVGSKITRSKNGTFILNLSLEFDPKQHQLPAEPKVLGVDLGIVKPLVCSDGKQFGSGRFIKHKKIEYGKKRAKHQSLKDEITDQQSRWTADINHKLSRQLINYCIQQKIDVLSLENLKGQKLSNRKYRPYNWAFKDLLTKVTYKAELEGIKVISVNPAYTSQTCSNCGSKSRDNRASQSKFHCLNCGTTMNADVNASKNIRSLSTSTWANMTLAVGKDQNLEPFPQLVNTNTGNPLL
jgi:IS605 OrfB family transposase